MSIGTAHPLHDCAQRRAGYSYRPPFPFAVTFPARMSAQLDSPFALIESGGSGSVEAMGVQRLSCTSNTDRYASESISITIGHLWERLPLSPVANMKPGPSSKRARRFKTVGPSSQAHMGTE